MTDPDGHHVRPILQAAAKEAPRGRLSSRNSSVVDMTSSAAVLIHAVAAEVAVPVAFVTGLAMR